MGINERALTKDQLRKLNAVSKSVGIAPHRVPPARPIAHNASQTLVRRCHGIFRHDLTFRWKVTMRRVVLLAVVLPCVGMAQAPAWEFSGTESDLSDDSRMRIMVNVKSEVADLPYEDQVRILMEAALERHAQDEPDAVIVSLETPFAGVEYFIYNTIAYAPDGCGILGGECTGEPWRGPMHGSLPESDTPLLGVSVDDFIGLLDTIGIETREESYSNRAVVALTSELPNGVYQLTTDDGDPGNLIEMGVTLRIRDAGDYTNSMSSLVYMAMLNLVFPDWEGKQDWFLEQVEMQRMEVVYRRDGAVITYKNLVDEYGDLELNIEADD